MIPYQEASQTVRRKGENIIKAAKTGASIAAGGGAYGFGSKMIYKALPFLSGLLPAKKAIEGLSKLDPRIGKFVKSAMESGQDFDQVKEFLTDKIEAVIPKEEEPAKDERNPIEQYSPDLNQFMTSEIGKGRTPIQAGAIAQNDPRFASIIKKLMKDHKMPWSDLLESIYGKEAVVPSKESQSQAALQPQAQMGQQQTVVPELMQGIQAAINLRQRRSQNL